MIQESLIQGIYYLSTKEVIMKKLAFALLILITACSPSNEKTESESQEGKTSISSTDAKDWLMKVIPAFFESTEMDLTTIATPEYAEYKSDAMNILYGDLTIPMFEKKWKGKYDVSDDAVGKAFLIDAQDYVKIEVDKCELIEENEKQTTFNVVLVDKAMKMEVKRTIEVVPFEGSFRISNVK